MGTFNYISAGPPARMAARVALVATTLLLGCNVISGAEGIVLDDDDDDGRIIGVGAGGSGAYGGSGGTNVVGGTGGVGGSGNNGGVGAAPQGGSGQGAGPTQCTYPVGPYGVAQGSTLSPSLHWQGFRENSSTQENISVQDYFDCDGTKGINAVLFSTVQWYCGACQQEAAELEGLMNSWEPMGIKVVVLLLTGSDDNPADAQDALQWKNNWGLNRVAVVADPTFTLVPGSSVGTPQRTVVDPRDMGVYYLQEGYSSTYPNLVSLAQQNANE